MKKWSLLNFPVGVFEELTQKLNVPRPLARVIASRPFFSGLMINGILEDTADFLEGLDLIDLDKAALKIEKALKENEKICIYGDYDADGVTSTAMLYLYLKKRGADVFYYIPDRNKEGYGLNIEAVDKIYANGAKLIITVDNGVSAVSEVAHVLSLGMEVVVTDHHKVPKILPKCSAIVDPQRSDCPSKFKNLAGVGVVFSLICFMENGKTNIEELLKNYAELALIGTIGDVMPLVSKNRILVSVGLKVLNEKSSVGVKALLDILFSKAKKVNSFNIAFSIVPKINATGRLDSAEKAVELLVTSSENRAKILASELDEINKRRKKIESEILDDINLNFSTLKQDSLKKILIIEGDAWPAGIIGIIAAKLLEKYHRPVIIISKLNKNIARGSARSVPGFSIYDAISKACSGYLLRFGGHTMAAGFDILPEDIEKFKKDILNYANTAGVPAFNLDIDAEIAPEELTYELADGISKLEPFGKDNEQPVFMVKNVTLTKVTSVGNGKHLKLYFVNKNTGEVFSVLSFFTNLSDFQYIPGDVLDLALKVEKNEYNGAKGVTNILIDIKFSEVNWDQMIVQKRLYEDVITGNCTSNELKIKGCDVTLSRGDFIAVYKYLKKLCKNGNFSGDLFVIYHRMKNANINFCKFILVLHVFGELNIVKFNLDGDSINISIIENKNKVLLEDSKVLAMVNALC